MAKEVRAIRQGFWGGHRRRAGAVFLVEDDAKENWFEPTGETGNVKSIEPAVAPAQAVVRKGFAQVMQELGDANASGKQPEAPAPQTLSEASAVLSAAPAAVAPGADLIG